MSPVRKRWISMSCECSSQWPLSFPFSSPITPGSPIWRQCVSTWAVPELHEVHLGAALQQLRPLHLLGLHLVPAHPPHRGPTLPLPSGLHGWLLWDGDQPVLLQPLPERRGVRPQRGRLHLYLPWRLHWWVVRENVCFCAAVANVRWCKTNLANFFGMFMGRHKG